MGRRGRGGRGLPGAKRAIREEAPKSPLHNSQKWLPVHPRTIEGGLGRSTRIGCAKNTPSRNGNDQRFLFGRPGTASLNGKLPAGGWVGFGRYGQFHARANWTGGGRNKGDRLQWARGEKRQGREKKEVLKFLTKIPESSNSPRPGQGGGGAPTKLGTAKDFRNYAVSRPHRTKKETGGKIWLSNGSFFTHAVLPQKKRGVTPRVSRRTSETGLQSDKGNT